MRSNSSFVCTTTPSKPAIVLWSQPSIQTNFKFLPRLSLSHSYLKILCRNTVRPELEPWITGKVNKCCYDHGALTHTHREKRQKEKGQKEKGQGTRTVKRRADGTRGRRRQRRRRRRSIVRQISVHHEEQHEKIGRAQNNGGPLVGAAQPPRPVSQRMRHRRPSQRAQQPRTSATPLPLPLLLVNLHRPHWRRPPSPKTSQIATFLPVPVSIPAGARSPHARESRIANCESRIANSLHPMWRWWQPSSLPMRACLRKSMLPFLPLPRPRRDCCASLVPLFSAPAAAAAFPLSLWLQSPSPSLPPSLSLSFCSSDHHGYSPFLDLRHPHLPWA
jgi:hypothetical protein